MKRTRVLLVCLWLTSMVILTSCGGGGGGGNPPVIQPPPTFPAPAIVTSALPTAVEGVAHSQQLQATGGSPPYTWSTDPTSFLAPGITMSSSGVVSGTGTDSFRWTPFFFTVTVRDSAGRSASGQIMMAAAGKIRFLGATLPKVNANISYGIASLPIDGGAPPYHLTVTSGRLPAGLSFNFETLTGTPTEFGTFNFDVQMADSDTPAQTTTASLTLVIAHDLAFPFQTL